MFSLSHSRLSDPSPIQIRIGKTNSSFRWRSWAGILRGKNWIYAQSHQGREIFSKLNLFIRFPLTSLSSLTYFNHHHLIFTISYHPLTFFWPYFIANFSLFRCILSPCCKFKEIFLFLLNLIVWIAMGSALDWKQKGWSAFDGQISLISDHPKRNLISENFKNVKPGM